MTMQLVPNAAVKAALAAYYAAIDAEIGGPEDDMRAALEAAVPHMRSSREESFEVRTEPDDGLLEWALKGRPAA